MSLTPRIRRILLDMDEVLWDFTAGALAVHGWTRPRLEALREPGQWSIPEVMGITNEQFWEPINALGYDFWANLQPLPWMEEVLEIVWSVTDDWAIVSSPSRDPQCLAGKLASLQAYFGNDFDRFIPTSRKHLFAQKGVLLLDDREENCTCFSYDEDGRATGGLALVFPSRGNWLCSLADKPTFNLRNRIINKFRQQEENRRASNLS